MARRRKTRLGHRLPMPSRDSLFDACRPAWEFFDHCYMIRRDKGFRAEVKYIQDEAEIQFGDNVTGSTCELKARIYYSLMLTGCMDLGCIDLLSERMVNKITRIVGQKGEVELTETERLLRDLVDHHYYRYGVVEDSTEPTRGLKVMANHTAKKKKKSDTEGSGEETRGRKARIQVFDTHAVTAVLRWIGSLNYSTAQARSAMEKLGIPVADGTINICVSAGRNNTDKKIAELNPAEIKKLKAALPGSPDGRTKAGRKSPSSAKEEVDKTPTKSEGAPKRKQRVKISAE